MRGITTPQPRNVSILHGNTPVFTEEMVLAFTNFNFSNVKIYSKIFIGDYRLIRGWDAGTHADLPRTRSSANIGLLIGDCNRTTEKSIRLDDALLDSVDRSLCD